MVEGGRGSSFLSGYSCWGCSFRVTVVGVAVFGLRLLGLQFSGYGCCYILSGGSWGALAYTYVPGVSDPTPGGLWVIGPKFCPRTSFSYIAGNSTSVTTWWRLFGRARKQKTHFCDAKKATVAASSTGFAVHICSTYMQQGRVVVDLCLRRWCDGGRTKSHSR